MVVLDTCIFFGGVSGKEGRGGRRGGGTAVRSYAKYYLDLEEREGAGGGEGGVSRIFGRGGLLDQSSLYSSLSVGVLCFFQQLCSISYYDLGLAERQRRKEKGKNGGLWKRVRGVE